MEKPLPVRKAVRRFIRNNMFSGAACLLGALPSTWTTRILLAPAFLARFSSVGSIATSNLEQALGETLSPQELRACHRGVFKHAARMTAEAAFFSRASSARRSAWFDRHVHVDESIKHLHRALARGQGVILATAHLGNWELIAAALAHIGVHGAVVGRFRERDISASWIVNMRERTGVTTLPQDSHPKRLLRVLKDGQVLGLVCDLDVKRLDGEFLPFFGRLALTMTAPAALARASKAPIIPVRCVRTREHPERYTILFDPGLQWDLELTKAQAKTQILTDLNATFEGWIRETPEQWAWYQPRWRTRPGAHQPMPLTERNRRNRP
ncbi:MAG: lysophospholipid acyltransferase family protein [Planctomycetes bacterium]|nr:lysophospholipid acyltransferase family protein [Planctomycetota bacterium]